MIPQLLVLVVALAVPAPAQAAGRRAPCGATSVQTLGPRTTTAAGLRKQTITVPVEAGWRMSLDRRDPRYVDTVVVRAGFYSQDTRRTVTFTPEIGFLGTASRATVCLTAPGRRTRVFTYAATVTLPPPPKTPVLRSTGPAGAEQYARVELPASGSIELADRAGRSRYELRKRQGRYYITAISGIATAPGRPMDPTLIGAAGFVNFAPAAGASGTMPTVRYRVSDPYGQTSYGTYTPTVTRRTGFRPPGTVTVRVGPAAAILTATLSSTMARVRREVPHHMTLDLRGGTAPPR